MEVAIHEPALPDTSKVIIMDDEKIKHKIEKKLNKSRKEWTTTSVN